MVWPVVDLINIGKETCQMSPKGKKIYKAALSHNRKRLFILLERMLEEDPNLIERVMGAPWAHTTALTCNLNKLLDNGQSNSQSKDMGKVGQEMPGWEAMEWDPLLGNKPRCGMFHVQCAELLAPIQYDWTNPRVCKDFQNGKLVATPLQFPQHLWQANGKHYKSQQPLDGLLQGTIPICAARCILFSPASVKTMSASTTQVSRAHGCSFKRSRGGMIGIAKVYNLTKVTTAFVAYVAVVVHHALTTKAIFLELCGGFNYRAYYAQICMFLEAPRFSSCAKVLLDWWNKQLFGLYNIGIQTLNKDEVSTLDNPFAEVEADPGLLGDEGPQFGGWSPDNGSEGDLE
ncbi:hypothetical protein RHS02_01027, partial [Rhizoctonia solani]